MILKSATTDTNILIIGEKGVGKTSCAKRIHLNSARNEQNFVEVSAATLQQCNDFQKILESANGGTLFIDEIIILNETEQSLLLKKLTKIPQPFRLIASSSKPLEIQVKSGILLEELYNRLCVIKIKLPNLQDRKEDIPYLIDYFLQEFSQKYNKTKTLTSEVFDKLNEKTWPGNIMELGCILEYAFMHSATAQITMEDLPVWIDERAVGNNIKEQLENLAADLVHKAEQSSIYMAMEEYKKMVLPAMLKAALDFTKGNKSRSAELLGINRNTFKKLIREYNIEN